MKQRSIIDASKHLINETKMLKCSLIGPIKNLHVKTGVLKIELAIIALHICAKSLFFIDLFQSDTSKDYYLLLFDFSMVLTFQAYLFQDLKI